MFCGALLYVLALDVVAMATVFYHSNRGNVELRGGDILAFAPSRLQLKVVFFFSVHVEKLLLCSFFQGVKGERGFSGPMGDKGDEVS